MNENEILFPPQREKTCNKGRHAKKLMSRSKSEHCFSRPFYDPLSPSDTFEVSEFFDGLPESTSESFGRPMSRKSQMKHEQRFYMDRSDIEDLNSPS